MWLCMGTRYDQSATCSLVSGTMPEPRVGDLLALNKSAETVAKTADVSIVIHPVSWSDARWCTFSDAAFGNASKRGSQIGYICAVATLELAKGNVAPLSALAWKSARCKRTIP